MTSAQTVSDELSAALDGDYTVIAREDGPQSMGPALNQASADIVVIARAVIDQKHLDAISDVVKRTPIPVLAP